MVTIIETQPDWFLVFPLIYDVIPSETKFDSAVFVLPIPPLFPLLEILVLVVFLPWLILSVTPVSNVLETDVAILLITHDV